MRRWWWNRRSRYGDNERCYNYYSETRQRLWRFSGSARSSGKGGFERRWSVGKWTWLSAGKWTTLSMRQRQEVEQLLHLGWVFGLTVGRLRYGGISKVNVRMAAQESYSETWNTGTNINFAMGTTRIYNVLQSSPPEYRYRFC